eukprot:scaffold370_cov192-Alexandrium_tamarense.AAC.8
MYTHRQTGTLCYKHSESTSWRKRRLRRIRIKHDQSSTDRLYVRYTPNLTSPLDTHVEIWVERYFVALVYSERSEGTGTRTTPPFDRGVLIQSSSLLTTDPTTLPLLQATGRSMHQFSLQSISTPSIQPFVL